MKAHIVYDSAYGNTKAVAEAIAACLNPLNAAAVAVADSDPEILSGGTSWSSAPPRAIADATAP